MQSLFLSQSYQDCFETYEKGLRGEKYCRWDYVILTASNEAQADNYRMQINYRYEKQYLPSETKYIVLPDPQGKRVGSGGATLNVLKFLAEENGGEADFTGKRVLVIHSGGDSKRVPQYSACGKIFSPVPRELPDGRTSTLFDEFMISMAGVAGRLKEGMLVLSGDVLLLFNPLQIDFSFKGAAALSIKELASIGKNHGVFLNNGHDQVGRFLHKQSEEQLKAVGAVNKNGYVDLDTGAVAFDTTLMQALFSLISTNKKLDHNKFTTFVNEKNPLSFYGDFLYPLAEESTMEAFKKEAGEIAANEGLLECREAIWSAISSYRMQLISLTPAEFIHFGTTKELRKLVTDEVEEYAFLGWKKRVGSNIHEGNYAAHNSMILDGAVVGEGAYIEYSVIGENVRIGNGSVISGLHMEGNEKIVIPQGVVLHGLKLQDGRFTVRIYEVNDNPKDECCKIMNGTILQTINANTSLWDVPIYPICETEDEAIESAMITFRMMKGLATTEEQNWWIKQERISLKDSFNKADVKAVFQNNKELADQIIVQNVITNLANEVYWKQAVSLFGKHGMNDLQEKQMEEIAEKADFSTAIRIYYALCRERELLGKNYEQYEKACFGTIKQAIYESGKKSIHYRENLHFVKEEAKVELPVRVNWGGGWSDTPPHCMEKGGTVINAAIKLNGIFPVQVTVRKIQKEIIQVASEDIGAYGEITTISEIQDCSNPYDSFALHKAALLACGIVPMDDETVELADILHRLGGGLSISTQVIGIPKGSGLGTSSILAGACVKALFSIMGEQIANENLYEIVLCMEQIMSTGGGWQDQVGGLISGIKFITSKPGLMQSLDVTKVEIDEETKKELQDRFVLIYTGQRRLARNLLRDVVGNYVGNREESLDALFKMQRVAALMRFELEKGNVDELAKLFNTHWELSKQLDAGSTNTCINEIFRTCDDLIDGKFVAGAGGGGFLQVILKKNVKKETLRERLKEVFQDSGVNIWDSEFYW